MFLQYFSIIVSSFLLTMLFINLFKKFSLSRNLVNSNKIPLVGGLGIGISFIILNLLTFFIYQALSGPALGMIITSFIMLVFGVIDDLREFSIQVKFLVQFIAVSIMILFGVRTHIVYIGAIANILITFIWVIGITNAFNHLDILDGLAGTIALIVNLGFLAVAFINGDIRTIILAFTLTGAIIAFLRYNLPPAKIYMGNSGSHFLGFILASIALIISYAPLTRKIALLSPLLILGVPILDTAFLILVRLAKRKLPFKKSNDHLALRFLALGYSKKRTLLIISIWGLVCSFAGVLVSQVPNLPGLVIGLAALLTSLFLIIKINRVSVNG